MNCPEKLFKTKVEVDASVKNYEFFNENTVDKWTLQHFFDWLEISNLRDAEARLREYKQSLEAISRSTNVQELKSFIGALKSQKFTKAQLKEMLIKSNKFPEVKIKITKPTIYNAKGNSRITVINTSREGKRKAQDNYEQPELHIDLSSSTSFSINGNDVLEKWNNYKKEANHIVASGNATVESNLQKIVSQTHVLLLKEDGVSLDVANELGSKTVDGIKESVMKKFDIQSQEVPTKIEKCIKVIIKQLKDKEILSRQASRKVVSLCSPEMDSSTDTCLLIVRNLVERLPLKKMNTIVKESQLCGTHVDAIIRPILDDTDNDQFLVWANTRVSDQGERPDIAGMLLIESSLKGPTCVGEVKGVDRKDDTYLSAFDLLKIASFSKEAIDNKQYQGVLGVHVVGLQINFYVTTLLAEGLYVMLELASVPIPSSVHDMKGFIANLEDLMPLRAIYKKCIQTDSNVQQFQKEGASLQTLLGFLKSGKDRKRHCSFVFNH